MCGIVAACTQRDVVPVLLAGLHALEYRGYDSAGIAVLDQGRLTRLRAVGKVAGLDTLCQASPARGRTDIAHTRWATHGVLNEANAHLVTIWWQTARGCQEAVSEAVHRLRSAYAIAVIHVDAPGHVWLAQGSAALAASGSGSANISWVPTYRR